MDYEGKYKDALSRARQEYNTTENVERKQLLEELIPELIESKDERIRKEIIDFLWKEKIFLQEAHLSVENSPKYRFVMDAIAWLEKQGKEKYLSEPIKDYQGSLACWNNAHDFRPKHLQRCICYDKYMKGIYCYVYDDISKYWCTQTTEEHDPDGDNHISDYADYRVPVWMPLPDISFYSLKPWLEKKGEQKEYTFKSLPRLLDMIEPTERAKAYCQKLIDTLVKERYTTDAKIVGECLKQMNGEKVALATMDNQKINKSEDERIRMWLIGYFRQYKEDGIEKYANGLKVDSIIAWLEKQGEKPKWTENDTSMMKSCIGAIHIAGCHVTNSYTAKDKEQMKQWLKSLKERMEEQQ